MQSGRFVSSFECKAGASLLIECKVAALFFATGSFRREYGLFHRRYARNLLFACACALLFHAFIECKAGVLLLLCNTKWAYDFSY